MLFSKKAWCKIGVSIHTKVLSRVEIRAFLQDTNHSHILFGPCMVHRGIAKVEQFQAPSFNRNKFKQTVYKYILDI